MRPEELADARARAAAASPGPWFVEGGAVMDSSRSYLVAHVGDPDCDTTEWARANAAFIACARSEVPALLAHIDYLEAVCADLARGPR